MSKDGRACEERYCCSRFWAPVRGMAPWKVPSDQNRRREEGGRQSADRKAPVPYLVQSACVPNINNMGAIQQNHQRFSEGRSAEASRTIGSTGFYVGIRLTGEK